MIFVSLGTQDKNFNRLIDYVLRLKKEIKSEVLKEIYIQIGQTKLTSKEEEDIENLKVEVEKMITPDKMQENISKADIVIVHRRGTEV